MISSPARRRPGEPARQPDRQDLRAAPSRSVPMHCGRKSQRCGQDEVGAIGFQQICRADIGFEIAWRSARRHSSESRPACRPLREIADFFQRQNVVSVTCWCGLAHVLTPSWFGFKPGFSTSRHTSSCLTAGLICSEAMTERIECWAGVLTFETATQVR